MKVYLPKFANDAMWRGYLNRSLDGRTIRALERNGSPRRPTFERRAWENHAAPLALKFHTLARKSAP